MKFYIYEPRDEEVTFFQTRIEWQKAMDSFDFHGIYCDDGWEEEVEYVVAGILPDGTKPYIPEEWDQKSDEEYLDQTDFYDKYKTHQAEKCNITQRPDDLDEDGYSEQLGYHWNYDFEYTCDYCFAAINTQVAS